MRTNLFPDVRVCRAPPALNCLYVVAGSLRGQARHFQFTASCCTIASSQQTRQVFVFMFIYFDFAHLLFASRRRWQQFCQFSWLKAEITGLQYYADWYMRRNRSMPVAACLPRLFWQHRRWFTAFVQLHVSENDRENCWELFHFRLVHRTYGKNHVRNSKAKPTLIQVQLWRSVTMWNNLLEFVKVFLKMMQLCKQICAAQTLRCCFERCELVRTTARALWYEDEWSVT